MIYNDFQGLKLSMLGFGAMRLPQLNGAIDEAQTEAMVRLAMENGVNYFDTAWPYHGGNSETVLCRALGQYPRESWYLADKYPGHQFSSRYDPADIFEKQLKKCGVEYFDFYLLHNVCELSEPVYLDPQWGIVDYFVQQRKLGRIRHLGFSSHAAPDGLKDILDHIGAEMEFCQIQLNYLDWTLQDARAKCELLAERGIPVWVMEPMRGGKLSSLDEAAMARLRAARPEATATEWALRWLQRLPQVGVVLSGMSSPEQMRQNIATFQERKPLSDAETALLMDVAETLKNAIPCTACRYCVEGCPMGLDIPFLLSSYNDFRFAPAASVGMRLDALPEDKRPSACIGCGACARICPQKIDIPGHLHAFAEELAKRPSWAQVCREREEAARKLEK